MKKILSIFLSLAIVASLCVCGSVTAFAAGVSGVAVGNTTLTADTYYKTVIGEVTTSGASASDYQVYYDSAEKTLTLNSAVINTTATSGIHFSFDAEDSVKIKLIGSNTVAAAQYVISATSYISKGSYNSDKTQVTIEGGTLTGTSAWGITTNNLTVDGSAIELTTSGHSSLRIYRNFILKNSTMTMHDAGNGGDINVDRYFEMDNSTLDLGDINIDYPSIFISNDYAPADELASPAVNIKNGSNLTTGCLPTSATGFGILANIGDIAIDSSDITLESVGGIACTGSITVTGSSTVTGVDKKAINCPKGTATIGAGVKIDGNVTALTIANKGTITGTLTGEVVGGPITELGGKQSAEVTGTYVAGAASETVYSVDITWGSMEFTYTAASEGTWKPLTHEYTDAEPAGWSCDANKNKITVTNHSNTAIDASLSYAKQAGYTAIGGSFTDAEGTAIESTLQLPTAVDTTPASAPTADAFLKLSGTLASGVSDTKIGTVTVTITQHPEVGDFGSQD